jgi:hypothetical protein
MLSRTLVAAALAAVLAPAAFAQDGGSGPPAPPAPPAPPPANPAAPAPAAPAKPAKHENKVSDAAKAAYEGMNASLYNPIARGLKEFQGKAAMKMEFPGMGEAEGMPPMVVDIAIAFTAPEKVTVDASTDNPMLAQAADQLKQQVQQLVAMGHGTIKPMEEEYDADLEEKDGVKTLVLKLYKDNEPRGDMRLTLGDAGLPSKGVLKAMDPNMGMETTLEFGFHYAKVGDKYRLEKQTVTHPMMPGPMETKISYLSAGEFDVLHSFETSGIMGSGTISFKYSELTVNGKKLDLPAAAKVEEKPATPTGPASPLPPATPPAPPAPEKKGE